MGTCAAALLSIGSGRRQTTMLSPVHKVVKVKLQTHDLRAERGLGKDATVDGSTVTSASDREPWDIAVTKYKEETNPAMKQFFLEDLVDYFMADYERQLAQIAFDLTGTGLLNQSSDRLVHLVHDLQRELQTAGATDLDLPGLARRLCRQWLQPPTP